MNLKAHFRTSSLRRNRHGSHGVGVITTLGGM
jgi:hypothetical protein